MLDGTGNLAMLSATALSPTVVAAEYSVTGTLTGPVEVGVYRSADPTFDASDVVVGRSKLEGAGLGAGTHAVEVGLSRALDIDPSRKYILVRADPAGQVSEADEADNGASFRTFIVGAVTHGYQPDGRLPEWVTTMADSLAAANYDATIPFDWTRFSALTAPEVVPGVARELEGRIMQAVSALPGFEPGDVVDVHLIGHSRGAGLMALTAGLLPKDSPPLRGGFLKLTMLDPYPGRDWPVAFHDASAGPIGRLAEGLLTRTVAQDPPPAVPADVDQAEVFYQHSPVSQAATFEERFFTFWGGVPVPGRPATYYDLTTVAHSHLGVYLFYQNAVVPTLATGTPVPLPSRPTPPRENPGSPDPDARPTVQGWRYERKALHGVGVSVPVGVRLLEGVARLDASLTRGRLRVARRQFDALVGFVEARSGRGIPPLVAQGLVSALGQFENLLPPQSQTSLGRSNAVRRWRV